MNPIYKCSVCKREHDTVESAQTCENKHVIIKPKLSWLIPCFGVIYFTYKFITTKNAIVIFDDGILGFTLQFWVMMTPWLSLTFLCLYLN